jgi:hypothetical protein
MPPGDAEELAERRANGRRLLDPNGPEVAARDAENLARAARRARSRVRRYVVANVLTRMLTLTFAPSPPLGGGQAEVPLSSAELVHGPGEDGRCRACGRPIGPAGVVWAMGEAASFVRRLRAVLTHEHPAGRGTRTPDAANFRLPYVVVPEYHADDHVHLHVLVRADAVVEDLQAVWGHGWVDEGKPRPERQGPRGRWAARKAAAYATKYVTKAFERAMPGRHRYEVAQGFQPAVVKRQGFGTLESAIADVADGHAQQIVYAVHSDGLEDYSGPPFLWVAFEDDDGSGRPPDD